MTFTETIKELDDLDLQMFGSYSAEVAKSFFVVESKKPKALDIKENLLERYMEFLNFYIAQVDLPRQSKIYWITFLDKLTLQREILELEKNPKQLANIKKAAPHLGKKMQSSFSE